MINEISGMQTVQAEMLKSEESITLEARSRQAASESNIMTVMFFAQWKSDVLMSDGLNEDNNPEW